MFGFMQSTAPSVAYDPFHAVKMAETGDITVMTFVNMPRSRPPARPRARSMCRWPRCA